VLEEEENDLDESPGGTTPLQKNAEERGEEGDRENENEHRIVLIVVPIVFAVTVVLSLLVILWQRKRIRYLEKKRTEPPSPDPTEQSDDIFLVTDPNTLRTSIIRRPASPLFGEEVEEDSLSRISLQPVGTSPSALISSTARTSSPPAITIHGYERHPQWNEFLPPSAR
jgi:hypothetical protein